MQNQIGASLSNANQVETMLRRQTQLGAAVSVKEACELLPNVSDAMVNWLLREFVKKGLVNRISRKDPGSRKVWVYTWDDSNEGGLKAKRAEAKIQKEIKENASNITAAFIAGKPAEEIELRIGGVLIVVGKNPETGRIRVVIE